MRNLLFSFLIGLALTLPGCTGADSYQVTTDDGTKVRVTAEADGIFRVQAVPKGASFSTKPSLAVLEQKKDNIIVTKEIKGEKVTISTPKASAVIDCHTGKVEFIDPEGNVLTSEDRREFSPIEVEGTKGWSVRQVFTSDENEGFYGLGQHQADEWNYKGRNEELYQYNTKISIPFIYSTKHYGILWDSYSLCRWGDPREYSYLGDVFTLYDKNGEKGALTGTYTPSKGEPIIRRENGIQQEYLSVPDCEKVVNAPEGIKFKGAKVLYEGELEPSESGLFHFYIYYAGYTKVFVGGNQVTPEIWRTAWNPNGRKFEVALEAGVRTPLRIEWLPDGDISYCCLKVLSPVDPEEQAKMSWWGEMQDQEDYYFIKGDNADQVISGYRTLTGKAPIMPKWAMGYWQSRERFTTQDELVSTFKEFRRRGIPIDNIVQDWQYWEPDQWGAHTFDKSRYPDPEKMIKDIHDMDGRIMLSVWPKFYTNTEHFKQLDEKGWIYQTPVVDSVEDWLGYQQSFYDAYSDGARDLFWKQMWNTIPRGIDAWWMDASEPNIHDCTDMDYRKKMCGPTALGPSTQYFNAYALMNAQAIYEGQRRDNPGVRVFLLTRNGFAGLQRYSTASWSGDIGTRWEDMKAQISAGLNFSISGIPFWGQDIGGFSVEDRYINAQAEDLEEWRELNVRWHQWGVFCPLYRSHGQYPTREPWNIAPEGTPAYDAIVSCDNFRYSLMPYIYSLTARVHFEDYTIMRPLVMNFDDPAVMDIGDEFMFGDAILVCPVYEYKARSREVYLPAGATWYRQEDGKPFEGGQTITADAPYGSIPVFFRSGQIVVTGNPVQSTAEAQTELTVSVYSGADASFTLYEDDGVSYDYENGAFATVPLVWDEASSTLTVGEMKGSFDGLIKDRKLRICKISPEGQTEFSTMNYTGNTIKIELK